MRLLHSTILAALVAVAHAQISALPACSLSCVTQAIASSGCSTTDTTCFCQTQTSAFSSSFQPCLLASCSAADIQSAANALENVCLGSSNGPIVSASSAVASAISSINVVLSSVASAASSVASFPVLSSVGTAPAISVSTAAPSTSTETVVSSSAPITVVPSKTAPTAYLPTASTMTIASGGGSTTSPQSTSNEGFNTGAKAGVGVSAALVAIIAILGIWFCLRQRRRRREQRAQHDLEITPAREHELGTSANTHEIDGKNAGNVAVAKKKFPFNENVAELSTPVTGEKSLRKAGVLEKPPLPEMGSTEKAIVRKDVAAVPELHAQPDVHEMPAVAAATNVGSDWEQLGASELDSEPAMIYHNASELPVSSHSQAALASPLSLMAFVGPGSSSSITAVHSTNTAAGAPVEDKLDILRQRIDRVREDKERLEKIQQLKDLEAELQREIMAEQTTVGDVV